MRAIYCILLSFVLFYIAVHIKGNSPTQNIYRGLVVLLSLTAIIVSVLLAILGL